MKTFIFSGYWLFWFLSEYYISKTRCKNWSQIKRTPTACLSCTLPGIIWRLNGISKAIKNNSGIFVLADWLAEFTQSCLTLCDPVDCSPPGSSIHGILQARILEWVAISFSRGSSRPRDRTQVSCYFSTNHIKMMDTFLFPQGSVLFVFS